MIEQITYLVKRGYSLKGQGVMTIKPIQKGEIVSALNFDSIRSEGTETEMSVQGGIKDFIDNSNDTIDNYFNHSCNPNMRLRLSHHYDFQAIREIKVGEELTWNYLTTEYDLTKTKEDFFCRCGSRNCYGQIKGFKYLTKDQKLELWNHLSAFLKTKI